MPLPPIQPYLPDNPTGASMIVCPGGGYENLADYEGGPIAQWLATLGIASYVLTYRLGPKHQHPAMLDDVQAAIRSVRANAVVAGHDPNRVGVMGFSAGGHLASAASVHVTPGDPAASDPVARVSSRPDVAVLIYPVISMVSKHAHAGSRTNLLGPSPTQQMMELMSTDLQVTPQTPPTFIYHRRGDPVVPVQHPLSYATALADAGVKFEMHIYDHRGHGQAMATKDPIDRDISDRLAHWLMRMNFAKKD